MKKKKKTSAKGAAKRSSARKRKNTSGKAPERDPKKKKVWLVEEPDALLASLMEKEREILQTEDALVESMRRFRDLFEQSPIGVGIHSTSGELLVVNKAYLDIFGLSSFGDITKHNLFSDMKLPARDAKSVRSGQVIQFEYEYDFNKVDFKTEREGAAHILFTISPLFRDEEIIGYMVQLQDTTERRKAEEAQRLAQLGRLLSDMAHEVNNPLMIISGRAELTLIEGVKDESVRDTLNIILGQCFQAKDIIQRLLKYSRIGKVKKTPVDISKILDLITDILGHHFHMTNIKLRKRVEKGMPSVLGNEKQLQQVFMNIVRNSADAMPDGGVITITARHEGEHVVIKVEDTGEGMSQKVLDRVFEPFFTTKQKGTGLGLAVCHTIIQEHAGDLRYESEQGKGTTATIFLPTERSILH